MQNTHTTRRARRAAVPRNKPPQTAVTTTASRDHEGCRFFLSHPLRNSCKAQSDEVDPGSSGQAELPLSTHLFLPSRKRE